jgi:hypothetical protein
MAQRKQKKHNIQNKRPMENFLAIGIWDLHADPLLCV